jgi:MFS superfamily sulfate permease-like transporter
MRQLNQPTYWSTIIDSPKQDFLASLVVFLVALPLCMGIAIASGVPVAAGLITGIVGGMVVGWFAGAPLQVSGPAAGLTVIVFQLVHEHGMVVLGAVVLIAGTFQLIAGTLRLGRWFRAVSPAVIHGMLAGVGVLIVSSQFHVMLDDSPKQTGFANLASIPATAYEALVQRDPAAGIGIVAIVCLIAWKSLTKGRFALVPAPLIAIVVAATVTGLMELPIARVRMPDSLSDAIQLPTLALLQSVPLSVLLQAGALIAIVASAETLLCAAAVEKMKPEAKTDYDRELVAQGIGNIVCGALGALPMTGVIVRSSANVESGGRTRLSAILHGAWLLFFVVALGSVVRLIPTAGLAAILVYTGFKLISVQEIKRLSGYGWSEVAVYAATLCTIVATDLLTGVIIGIAMSFAKLLMQFSHLNALVIHGEDGYCLLHLSGAATFLRLPVLASAFDRIWPGQEVHVDLERLDHMDHACMDLLMSFAQRHEQTGGSLIIDWGTLDARVHGVTDTPHAKLETDHNFPRRFVA